MTDYYIPRHVYVAFERDAAIFLDLRRDRYSMFLGTKAHAFKTLLSPPHNSPARFLNFDEPSTLRDHALDREVLAELLENSLLTTDGRDAAFPIHADISAPEHNLLDASAAADARTSLSDALRFVISCVTSHLRLKYLGIERTIRSIERRKHASRQRTSQCMTETEMCRLVQVYRKLRPLYPRDYLCLFDSLSLLRFLAYYGFHPTWVFAVKLDPWAAHCWLQYGAIALNEDAEAACSYRPILTV